MAKKTISKTSAKKPRAKKAGAVEVKGFQDIIRLFNNLISKNLHERFGVRFSKSNQVKIVAYGPWLSIAVLLLLAPELLVLANNAMFISPIGFLEKILFNRDSWVLLIIMFINIISAVDALSELFDKTMRGWNRVYVALLINMGYVFYQLLTSLEQPAAPLLSLVVFGFCLFTLLDIRQYYK